MRKIIIYQRGATKPIILTDASKDTSEEIKTKILELFNSTKISAFETESDTLYIRPSEIQSILITKGDIPDQNKPVQKEV